MKIRARYSLENIHRATLKGFRAGENARGEELRIRWKRVVREVNDALSRAGVCFHSFRSEEALKMGYFGLIYSRTKVYNICAYLNSAVHPLEPNLRINIRTDISNITVILGLLC